MYGAILRQVAQPVILHWPGDMFDPQLAGYWGSSDIAAAMATCLAIIRDRAIDEAAELGAGTVALVCGPPPDRDIAGARRMVEDAIAVLVPYARERNVAVAIEPLHPMYAAERSCITSLEEANILAEKFDPATVGIIVDVYHVWWDAMLEREIARARGRIRGFHLSDWQVPTTDMLMGRGMMGDGCIDLHRMRTLVEAAGYQGYHEVEILNQRIWDAPGDDVLALMKERYRSCVANKNPEERAPQRAGLL